MTRANGNPRRCRLLRLTALFLLAWLNLLVQPALAAPRAMPAGMAHCDHGGTAAHPAPCAEMQASDCSVAGTLGVDSPRAATPARHGTLLAILPPPRLCSGPNSEATTAVGAASATGPPLIILFGHLRN